MIDPVQVAVGIIVLLIVVGALLYIVYSRTNAVEKTGYGALAMLSIIALMIPVLWIVEAGQEANATASQFTYSVQQGAMLYAQYCYQCHGTKGQGYTGPQLNNSSAVNNLKDTDIMRIISAGIYSTTDPTTALMPAWSQDYGGPLTNDDIQYLFDLIRSSDTAYLTKNGYATGTSVNGFLQVPNDIQLNNPSAYATQQALESSGQFGAPTDMTNKKAITMTIVSPTGSENCNPDCFTPINVKVKVGTTITWINQSPLPHTVTAIKGTDLSNKVPLPNIFDSGISGPLTKTGGKFTWTVTTAAYSLNSGHVVLYYCEIHPGMVAELTIVP